jgi:hypothetical protein
MWNLSIIRQVTGRTVTSPQINIMAASIDGGSTKPPEFRIIISAVNLDWKNLQVYFNNLYIR